MYRWGRAEGHPDRIAHILFAMGITYLLGYRTPDALLTALVFAPLPDLDLLFRHREMLHNLFFILGFPLALRYIAPQIPFPADLIALTSHVALDMLSPAGVSLFFPITSRRFGLGIVRSGWPTLAVVLLFLALILFLVLK